MKVYDVVVEIHKATKLVGHWHGIVSTKTCTYGQTRQNFLQLYIVAVVLLSPQALKLNHSFIYLLLLI